MSGDARLGRRYQDVPTGYTGVCVGVWARIGGVQLSLSRIGTDGFPKEVWLDEERLVVIATEDPSAAHT